MFLFLLLHCKNYSSDSQTLEEKKVTKSTLFAGDATDKEILVGLALVQDEFKNFGVVPSHDIQGKQSGSEMFEWCGVMGI